MSSFSAGQRIVASWLGGAWEPATVIELGAGGMLKVRFDDGREVFIASMNARAAPAGTPASAPGAASNTGLPPQPPPPDGFHPIAPGQPASAPAIPQTMAQPVSPTMPAQAAFPAQPPPVSPVAPTMPVQAVNPAPAAPVSPAPAAPSPDAPPGEFKPIQGAPLDGAGGAMPPGFNPFEPSGGGNKNG